MMTYLTKKYPLSFLTACVIICLSLFPIPELPQVEVPLADKWTHMVMYGAFCLIIWFEYLRSHNRIQTGKITLCGWFCPIVMSGLLELAQEYLTNCRSGEWMDLLANTIGATIAYLLGWTVLRRLVSPKTVASLLLLLFALPTLAQEGYPANYARGPRFKALIYYSNNVESAHKEFAEQALKFFHKLSYGEGFLYDKTTDLSQYTDEQLAEYDVQIWLNNSVHGEKERKAFERYMENGGGWIGFHAAAYNDKNTRWPWFVNFLGGGVFYCNNWPPQPALVVTDTDQHTVTKSLPREFVIPSSEWYQWNPSPRKNPDVEVLLSISPKNYPLGIKDVVKFGDFPIVWTNKKYRMVYLNGGHGDECFTDATTNLLYVNVFRWVVSTSPKGNPFEK
jgi:type 1 glutamine amidotransferase/VanZ family protein